MSSKNYVYRTDIELSEKNAVVDEISVMQVYLKTCLKENSKLKEETKELRNKIDSITDQLELYKKFDNWYYRQNIFKRFYWHIRNYNKTYLITNYFTDDENV